MECFLSQRLFDYIWIFNNGSSNFDLGMTTHLQVSTVSEVVAIERHADVITSKFGATM